MAKYKEKEKAIKLRKAGESYNRIRQLIKVSKGTLSLWLRDYPLPEKRLRELRDWNAQRIEKYRETRRKQREERLGSVYKKQRRLVSPFSKRELFLAGLFLYWGEGTKYTASTLILSNTDPAMIKFYIKWLEKALGVPRNKMRIRLQLYKDMDIAKEHRYWSEIANIPLSQFRNPQIKESSRQNITHKKGGFGHGTCEVQINNVMLGEKVFMSIKAIRDSMRV